MLLFINFIPLVFNNINYCETSVNDTIKQINHSRGNIDINKLASSACLSRKQFERVFADAIGTSPRQFIKTVRFQHAIHEKSLNQNLSLSSLTYECGYYDQSHMINDFYQFSGMTPKQYFDVCEPFSDYFQ